MADSAVHYAGRAPSYGGGKSLSYPCAGSGIGHACISVRREARQEMGKALAAWLLVATAAASPAVSPRDVVQSAVSRVVIALQKTETPLEYRLHLKDGRWKVYDILIDNVSFVSTYRSEFSRILQRESYAVLLDRLRKQSVEGAALIRTPRGY